MELEVYFFALLKKNGEGHWAAAHWGFAGYIGAREEAQRKLPKANWMLFQ
jgi:hypothetical protein